MTLPTINVPTYELKIPSTKEKIKFRPFLVKEEKILLLALESGEDATISIALKQIVNNCTFEKLVLDDLALFDLEYLFLRVRAKSVGEVAHIRVMCPDDGETYVEVDVPLEEIEVNFPDEHTNDIKITDTVGVTMGYPQFEDYYKEFDENETSIDYSMNLIRKSIRNIYEGEDIHEKVDFNDKELTGFLESLNTDQFTKLQNFFSTMPRLKYDVEVTNPKTEVKSTVTLEGLNSFFV